MAKSLGDVLVAQGLINSDVLEEALALQTRDGGPLGRTLVSMGAVTEPQIVAAVARQMGVPFADCSPGAVLSPRVRAAGGSAVRMEDGIEVRIDPRDRSYLLGIPNLRQV